MRNYLLKRVQTMTISKVPWRKPPIPKQVAVICTRLILPDAVPAVKKYEIRRGSERTICLSKCPSRTVKGGAEPAFFQFRYTPLPGRQTVPIYLSKSMMVAVPTHPRAVKKQASFPTKKRMLSITGGILLINYLDLYLSISNRILNSCSCSSGVLAERNS